MLKCIYTFYSCRIYGTKSVVQVKHCVKPHQGQGVCALEDQALHSIALFPKLQTYLTLKNRKHTMMAGSRSKPEDKVSRIRPRDMETMLIKEGCGPIIFTRNHLWCLRLLIRLRVFILSSKAFLTFLRKL